jgi:hypothetical protein
MLGDLRISLYELFGHLVPGTVMLAAAVIAVWALFYPNDALAINQLITAPWYVALILVYLAGILTQTVATQVEHWLDNRSLFNLSERTLDPELRSLVEKARDQLRTDAEIDFHKAHLDWLFRVCDEALAQSERAPDRETYRYREGLCRGLAMSFLVLAAAVAARAAIVGAALQMMNGTIYPVSRGLLLAITAVALLTSALCFIRFLDIRSKRFARAIVGFVMLRNAVTYTK